MKLFKLFRFKKKEVEIEIGDPTEVRKTSGFVPNTRTFLVEDTKKQEEFVQKSYRNAIGKELFSGARSVSKNIMRHVSSTESNTLLRRFTSRASNPVPKQRREKLITPKKFLRSLRRMGLNSSESQLVCKAIFMMQKEKTLTENQLKLGIQYLMSLNKTKSIEEFGFNFFDINHDGTISKNEFSFFLEKFFSQNFFNVLKMFDASQIFNRYLKEKSKEKYFEYMFFKHMNKYLTEEKVKVDIARRFCERYLVKGSPYELQFPSEMRDLVYQKVQICELEKKNEVEVSVFRNICENVKKDMEENILVFFTEKKEYLVESLWDKIVFPQFQSEKIGDYFLLDRDSFESEDSFINEEVFGLGFIEFKNWVSKNKIILEYFMQLQNSLNIATRTMQKCKKYVEMLKKLND
eukprot:snap_masked-scaffold_30-processed-gene-3.35-mRNA-1 protein AED:1.00 eAED:1.00 QI:0/0/0/0/1/1/2/0/405